MTELYRRGGNVTLGHDFVKCFQVGDEAMFAYIVSHMWGDALLPADLLRMSTTNGARALGMQGELGMLRAGHRAGHRDPVRRVAGESAGTRPLNPRCCSGGRSRWIP